MATDPTKPLEEDKNVPQVIQDRNKTFSQIIAEQQTAKPTEETVEKTPEEVQKETEEAQVKQKEDEENVRKAKEEEKRAAAELAAQTAADVVQKQQQAQEEAKRKALEAEEAEKRRQEALKPRFTAKDANGNPLPSSYEEATLEGARIGKEEALAEFEKRQAERDAKALEAQQKQQEATAQKEQTAQAFSDQLKKDLDSDEAAIYAAGDLPKIKDPANEKDPGILAKNHLYETAQKVNAKRIAAGQPLIRSLQIIRYGRDESGKPYYTPLKTEVPGHDAPVLGSESAGTPEPEKSTYNVARDRRMSPAQIIADEARKAAKRLGIRGN